MSANDHPAAAKRPVGSTALALGIVWAAGIVLMVGKPEWFGKLRSASIDAAAPAMTLVRLADQRWVDPLRARLATGVEGSFPDQALAVNGLAAAGDHDGSFDLSTAHDDARRWQQQCELLQIQLARAEQDRQRAEDRWLQASEVELASFLVHQPAPLLAEQLIPANWIGQIGRSTGELHPLLSVGAREGIAIDELVLDAEALHLDRGAGAGVKHDAVVLDGRRLIGRIVEVGHWTSTIQPVTDPEFRLSVQLLRTAGDQSLLGARGVLSGNGSGGCRMTYVDATLPVVVGDLVVTPPDDPHFTAMLLCGRVTRAELQEGSLEWQIEVEPATSLDELTSVSIIHQSLRTEQLSDP